jgi:Monooxygenase af470-like
MAKVRPGRFTAQAEGDFVVFLIGMRINKPLKVHRWLPVFLAMRPMIAELEAHPDKGMLYAQFAMIGSSPAFVQYWRSFEHLAAFARNPDDPHLPAWKRFNQRVRGSGDVGIWHETYRVTADDCEAIYGNMPRWGLAEAFEHGQVGSTTGQSAAKRLGVSEEDAPALEPY